MILPMKYSGNKQMFTIFGIVILFPIFGLQGFMCNVFAEERLMLMFFSIFQCDASHKYFKYSGMDELFHFNVCFNYHI